MICIVLLFVLLRHLKNLWFNLIHRNFPKLGEILWDPQKSDEIVKYKGRLRLPPFSFLTEGFLIRTVWERGSRSEIGLYSTPVSKHPKVDIGKGEIFQGNFPDKMSKKDSGKFQAFFAFIADNFYLSRCISSF